MSYLLAVILSSLFLYKVYIRLRLSQAKHPSLRGHAKWSRRMARLISYFEYDRETFFNSDHAPEETIRKRRLAMDSLQKQLQQRCPQSLAVSESLENVVSDVRFTSAYRVPFPYRRELCNELKLGSIVDETQGVQIKDIDGNWRYDVSGSYGVNVFGYDFYKDCMKSAFSRVENLGPVLGPYHPVIKGNVDRLLSLSGLDEVSFHMSGTEAVMQAVRMARYHTGRSHLVRMCGAYHGWWDGVQPGVGNQRKVDDVYTLNDMSPKTLKVLETRHDIACVLINPLQAFHPNGDAPSDASLIAGDRAVSFNREQYTRWLKQVRDVCTRRNIVLIFDEVFTGFRLGYRGAQEYFGIQADMVTYGKTLGGGLPVGVLCGRHHLMKRFKDKQPANVSFARGTFNSHPYVMAAMNEFLQRIEAPCYQEIYQNADAVWNRRVAELNERLMQAKLPVSLANMQSILTFIYHVPSRYNWMLQFYLRSDGLELSWIGSGRMIMSLNYSDTDFNEVADRIVHAAQRMAADGWWWHPPHVTNKDIKKQFVLEMFYSRFPILGRLSQKPTHLYPEDSIEKVH